MNVWRWRVENGKDENGGWDTRQSQKDKAN